MKKIADQLIDDSKLLYDFTFMNSALSALLPVFFVFSFGLGISSYFPNNVAYIFFLYPRYFCAYFISIFLKIKLYTYFLFRLGNETSFVFD